MTWGQRSIASGFTYVLAALLGPHQFGLVALVLAFVELVQVVVQQGSSTAPVQRERLEQEHLDAAFGRASGGASCSRSRPSPRAVGGPGRTTPELEGVTVGLSASVAILGLMIDLLSLLQRQVRFRELSACWNVGALAGGGSGLALALLGAGVWAFVVQRVVMDAVPLLGRWAATRRLRRPLFSRRHARELLGCSGLGERLRRQPRRVSSTGVLTRC